MVNRLKKIGFLLSGKGTTLQAFIDWQKNGRLKAEVAVVISSRKDAAGLDKARAAGIPAITVEYSQYRKDTGLYSTKITEILQQYQCALVVMGGFNSFYQVPDVYHNKVINIHPSLIPAFSGQGMYGIRVHQAAVEAGVKVSGCTIHIVDSTYDHGPIIEQATVPVLDSDTAESLAERVKQREKEIYPEVINNFIDGNYVIERRKVLKKGG